MCVFTSYLSKATLYMSSSRSHSMTKAQLKSADRALQAALLRILDGNLSELARRCDVTPQAVQWWIVKGAVPAQRVVQVCNALDNEVTEHQLRPDVFRSQ
jgi:hypothetical protein